MRVAIEAAALPEVKIVRPQIFTDLRGSFTEIFRADTFDAAGLPSVYVQMNRSRSYKNVVRGLHFQWDPPMGKLMTVTRGSAFLVAVDVRPESPTLGRWVGQTVSESDNVLIWAPAYFARGFCALSDDVCVDYLCTGIYNSSAEYSVRWDDPAIGVEWPTSSPVISDKDRTAQGLANWLQHPAASRFRFADTVASQ